MWGRCYHFLNKNTSHLPKATEQVVAELEIQPDVPNCKSFADAVFLPYL